MAKKKKNHVPNADESAVEDIAKGNSAPSNVPEKLPAVDSGERALKFGTRLAHTDKKVREKGFKIVQKWLQKNADSLDAMEMMKVWKALWYAFWMSDKTAVQQELAVNLALTMNVIPEDRWTLWIVAFWETMQSSWERIDRHRMNKYLLLMRCFLAETLKYLRLRKWDEELITDLNQMLVDVSPLPLTVAEGSGVSMQYVSMFLTEFELQHAESPCSESRFLQLLEPFFRVILRGKQHTIVQHVHDKVLRTAPSFIHSALQSKLLDLSADPKVPKVRRVLIHDTVLMLRGQKKEEPHPLLGRRSRPVNDVPEWEKRRKKRKAE